MLPPARSVVVAEPLLAFISKTNSSGNDSASWTPPLTPPLTLHLWNAATRQMVAEILVSGTWSGLAFSKDGKTLVTSAADIILWRASDRTKLASYPTELTSTPGATSFAATPDLRLAAYTRSPNMQKVCVADLRNGKELWTAVASAGLVTALVFSPDGTILASADGYSGSDIYLWDAATGEKIGQLAGHNSWVASLVFWPDGKKLASASADQTIRIWDVASRKCLDVMHGSRDEVWRLALLPDNKTLASGCKDGSVCFWDTSVTHARQANIALPVSIPAWTFAPDSRSVLTLDGNGEVARWTGADFKDRKALFEVRANVDLLSRPFSGDGRFLATSFTNGIVSIWDVSRQVLWRDVTNGADYARPLCFDAGGNKLVTHSSDNMYHEWDVNTGLEAQSWPGPMPTDGAIALSPDDHLCVVGDVEGEIASRNLTEKNNVPLPLETLEPGVAAFSPEGKFFAVPSALGYVKVWSTKTWKEVATLRGFILGVHSVAFSPDGKRLATGGGARAQALRLWDTDDWQNVITLQNSDSFFVEPLFSPDGNSVGALSYAGILHVWPAPSWAEINALEVKEKAESKQD